jgi:hypothetical protein
VLKKERFRLERDLNHVIDSESLNANGIATDSKLTLMFLNAENLIRIRPGDGFDPEDH